MLNRGVLMVRPKQPFLNWVAKLEGPGLVPDEDADRTVYLIPSFESDEEASEILAEVFSEVFERELWDWHTDSSAWPRKRDLATFREWFEVEMHSVVEDLCEDAIADDEA